VEIVTILSVSYSLEKNSYLGGGVTKFRDQTRTCTKLVHIISRLINQTSRPIFSLVDLYLSIVD